MIPTVKLLFFNLIKKLHLEFFIYIYIYRSMHAFKLNSIDSMHAFQFLQTY